MCDGFKAAEWLQNAVNIKPIWRTRVQFSGTVDIVPKAKPKILWIYSRAGSDQYRHHDIQWVHHVFVVVVLNTAHSHQSLGQTGQKHAFWKN